jgi:hypothetical protein
MEIHSILHSLTFQDEQRKTQIAQLSREVASTMGDNDRLSASLSQVSIFNLPRMLAGVAEVRNFNSDGIPSTYHEIIDYGLVYASR